MIDQERQLKKCSNGHGVPSGAKHCGECGIVMHSASEASKEPRTGEGAFSTCPNGHAIEYAARFCPECGGSIQSTTIDNATAETPRTESAEGTNKGQREQRFCPEGHFVSDGREFCPWCGKTTTLDPSEMRDFELYPPEGTGRLTNARAAIVGDATSGEEFATRALSKWRAWAPKLVCAVIILSVSGFGVQRLMGFVAQRSRPAAANPRVLSCMDMVNHGVDLWIATKEANAQTYPGQWKYLPQDQAWSQFEKDHPDEANEVVNKDSEGMAEPHGFSMHSQDVQNAYSDWCKERVSSS